MTPAEKLGYKVGDWFEMLESRDGFEAGQKVVLFRDGGSSMALFQGRNVKYNNADGKQGAYTALRSVKPLTQQQETTMKTTSILKKDGTPFATESSATQRMNALGLQDTHTVMVHGNGYAIFANALSDEPVTNGGGVKGECGGPEVEMPGTMIKDETTMHLTDLLYQARQERDEAQARYERALADHRATYPWLVVEERSDTTAIDLPPEEWRAGDVVEFIWKSSGHYTNGGKYKVESVGSDDIYLEDDDSGEHHWPLHDDEENAIQHQFRFIRRP